MVMVNLGSTDDSRYTGYREITDRDVLDLQCIEIFFLFFHKKQVLTFHVNSLQLHEMSNPVFWEKQEKYHQFVIC